MTGDDLPIGVDPQSVWGKTYIRGQRMQTALIALIAVIAVLSLILGIRAEHKGNENERRLAHDEYVSCVIQVRGLKASPFLVGTVGNIDEILELTSATPAERAQLPKPLFNAIFNLKYNSSHYVAITKNQPPGRVCVKP